MAAYMTLDKNSPIRIFCRDFVEKYVTDPAKKTDAYMELRDALTAIQHTIDSLADKYREDK
jgi:hypothetical protein